MNLNVHVFIILLGQSLNITIPNHKILPKQNNHEILKVTYSGFTAPSAVCCTNYYVPFVMIKCRCMGPRKNITEI